MVKSGEFCEYPWQRPPSARDPSPAVDFGLKSQLFNLIMQPDNTKTPLNKGPN